MRKVKSMVIGVKRIIQTAPYETLAIEMTETYDLDPEDDLEVQRTRAYRKLALAVEKAADAERERYAPTRKTK